MKKPNLFIIGEPRCGTTSLYKYLKEHSQIFMPADKEPQYFGKDLNPNITNLKNYLKLFSNAEELIVGEASTKYLYSKVAAKNIKKFNPQAKFIAIFREPIDFLKSYHSKQVQDLNEPLDDLRKALRLEENRKKGKNLDDVKFPESLYYSERLKYSKHLNRYLELFSDDQFLIIIFDDLKRNIEKVYYKILKFLSLKKFQPKFKKYNVNRTTTAKSVRKVVENKKLIRFLKSIIPRTIYDKIRNLFFDMVTKKTKKKKLPSIYVKKLKKRYKPEVIKLNKLLHKHKLINKNRNLINEWGYE